MDPFYADYLLSLNEIHDEVRKAIHGLSPDQLDWSSGPEMNSVTVMIIHLIGAERYWIGDVVRGESSGRDREAEFLARGLSEADLVSRLAMIEAYAQEALTAMSVSELQEQRISPRNGREVSVGWALCHALKHTALHAGHIQMTHQLWEQKSVTSKSKAVKE